MADEPDNDEPDNIVLAILRKVTAGEEGLAGVNRRFDRLENRVERSEKRLELSDATH